ncbi:MAG: hypothetical protein ACYCTE_13610 [Acidimicrobiales bacterium]
MICWRAFPARPRVVEMLAPYRGAGPVAGGMLRRIERPLGLARIDLHDDAPLIDLDDPVVLTAIRLRPSVVEEAARLLGMGS